MEAPEASSSFGGWFTDLNRTKWQESLTRDTQGRPHNGAGQSSDRPLSLQASLPNSVADAIACACEFWQSPTIGNDSGSQMGPRVALQSHRRPHGYEQFAVAKVIKTANP